jgi:hypothetical protein
MGRQPSVIASNDDASPSGGPPALLRTSGMLALAPRHWLCQRLHRLARSGPLQVHDSLDTLRVRRFEPACGPGPLRIANCSAATCSGGRLWCRVRLPRLAVSDLEPARLSVDVGDPHAGPRAPRAGRLAGRPTEVGDDLTAAAAGHTLPRLMRRWRLTLVLAVIAAVAWHEPMRLAFAA